ncbi:MAG: hypothetical protein Q9186_002889 [Xanthomendoza sp. 1 TL-2023]
MDDYTDAMIEGTRLESQLRDSLQLQAGTLGLEESRKSIELSDRQIEEAKRVKVFTSLAFVYVPLNLVTSIYGMNLQQLIQTGRSVQAFVITPLIALVITAGAWLTSRSCARVPTFNIAQRLSMILWLVLNRHGRWMMTTGAWWRILLNSGRLFHGIYDSGELLGLPAGKLVLDVILQKLHLELAGFNVASLSSSENFRA